MKGFLHGCIDRRERGFIKGRDRDTPPDRTRDPLGSRLAKEPTWRWSDILERGGVMPVCRLARVVAIDRNPRHSFPPFTLAPPPKLSFSVLPLKLIRSRGG